MAPATEPVAPLQGLRLLVIDDNPVNRELVSVILRPLGCSVSTAEDGEAGLAVAGQTPFDLILIDRHMPDLDGEQVARRLRRGSGPNADALLIAFTADVLADATDAFDGMIAKPVMPLNLVNAIGEHLEKARSVSVQAREQAYAVG